MKNQSDEERYHRVISPAAQRHRRLVGIGYPGRGGRDPSIAADQPAADEQQRRADVVLQTSALVPAVCV